MSLQGGTAFSRSRTARCALAACGRLTILERLRCAVRPTGRGNAAPQRKNIMNDKSHVSLEQHLCLVCGVPFDTGSLLLDRRLKASLEHRTTTGWGLCTEHQKMFDDGFVALIECDPQRSGAPSGNARLKPEQAYRTGRLAHLKRHVFAKIFNVPIADDQSCVFVEPGVIEKLQSSVAHAD